MALFDVLHAVTFDPTTIDGVWESTNSATPTRVRITRFTLALAIRCHDLAVIPPDAVAGLRAPIEGSASMQQLIVQRDSEASAKGGPACRLQLGQGETLPYELSNGSLTLHSINQSWTFQKVSD